MDTICKICGQVYEDQNNIYGKICTYCGSFIEPEKVPDFICNNIKERDKYIKEARKKIKDRIIKEQR